MKRLALVMAAVTGLLVPGPAAHATAATDPTTLPRGSGPELVWLGGRTIHGPRGEKTHVPVPANHAWSFDGQCVAGYNVRMNRLQVRSMSDAALAPVTLKDLSGDVLGWEPDGHVIVGVHTGLGNALVRCAVDGTCERATRWLRGQAINLPYTPQYFGEY